MPPLHKTKPEDMYLKGKYLGLCNRSGCLRPGANWINPNMQGLFYCSGCGPLLNHENYSMPYWKMCRPADMGVCHLDEFLSMFAPDDKRPAKFRRFYEAKYKSDPFNFSMAKQQLNWEEEFLEHWETYK